MSASFGPGCPWYDLSVRYPANLEWCEAKVCGWILTPFNTWTNLAYLALGAYLVWHTRAFQSRVLKTFGPTLIIIGLTSFFYHATLNYFSHMTDMIGMYLFCMTFIMINHARLGWWPKPPRAFKLYWASTVGLTLLTVASLAVSAHFPIQLYVMFLIFYIIWSEFRNRCDDRRWFWVSMFCWLCAAVISALDVSGTWCVPDRHWLQGHGIWHVTNCLGLYFAYLHYRQFESKLAVSGY